MKWRGEEKWKVISYSGCSGRHQNQDGTDTFQEIKDASSEEKKQRRQENEIERGKKGNKYLTHSGCNGPHQNQDGIDTFQERKLRARGIRSRSPPSIPEKQSIKVWD